MMLCKEHKDKAFIMSIGRCARCGGAASSGAHKLCRDCATETNQCAFCLKPLDAKED